MIVDDFQFLFHCVLLSKHLVAYSSTPTRFLLSVMVSLELENALSERVDIPKRGKIGNLYQGARHKQANNAIPSYTLIELPPPKIKTQLDSHGV